MSTNFDNGLKSFAFHEAEDTDNVIGNINSSKSNMMGMLPGAPLKPEDIARSYLETALEEQHHYLADFSRPVLNQEAKLDFEAFQTEDSPFTENKIVKFRQKVNNISVYGSNVNVELDKDFNLVSINSAMAEAINVPTTAKIAPEAALRAAEVYIKNSIPESAIPMLYLYFFEGAWKLVYMIKNVVSRRSPEEKSEHAQASHQHGLMNYVNVIVDAETGDVLKESPRVMSLNKMPEIEGVIEDYIHPKQEPLQLINEEYKVYTYDLNYTPYNTSGALPGQLISKSGNNWLSAGAFAHYHACKVMKFLRDVLRRNGVDNKGMKLLSTVQCVEQEGVKAWNNAAWLSGSKQMIYGQIAYNGDWRSLAFSLDIVAHEILHGVTNFTSNLDYEKEPGALNESYSDIFGIIISNYETVDRSQWNWQLGEETSGVPIRDLSDPAKFGQPAHMAEYMNLPNNKFYDWGGVHYNSGIHNKAAYNMLSAADATGKPVFSSDEAAILFYSGLIQLSNSSGFSDSSRSILNAAKSLYRKDHTKDLKIKTIKDAFQKVGIQ